MTEKCHECERTIEEIPLQKCSVCFKYFCEKHAYSMSGRSFCTRGCAQHFFFADPDD